MSSFEPCSGEKDSSYFQWIRCYGLDFNLGEELKAFETLLREKTGENAKLGRLNVLDCVKGRNVKYDSIYSSI